MKGDLPGTTSGTDKSQTRKKCESSIVCPADVLSLMLIRAESETYRLK